jgi:hypothetical protein
VYQILVAVRGDPRFGGNGTEISSALLNDTGSNLMNILQSDLTAMGIRPSSYRGYSPHVKITTANGTVRRRTLQLQIQLRDQNGTAASDWFIEEAAIVPRGDRLSGEEIRNRFYFATPPGNAILCIAEKKNGLLTALPVV